MKTIEQAEHDVHFRTAHIDIMHKISNRFGQYSLKENRVQVSVLSVPTDNNKELLMCYVQFDPKEINAEKRLHETSHDVYNIDDQVFLCVKCDRSESIDKMDMIRDYLDASLYSIT